MPKRKRVALSMDKKYEVLQMLDNDESYDTIAEKYGISSSAVGKIKARRKGIKEYVETRLLSTSSFTRRLNAQYLRDLERVLYHWCKRCKDKKIILTRQEIRGKALEFNEILNGDPNFKAGKNWFETFKKRCLIHQKDNSKDTTNTSDAEFRKFLQDEGYELKNVYNATYIPLMWKAVPKQISIFEESTASPQMYKDHVTIVLCANATGCHKLPVLVIGKTVETQSIEVFNRDGLTIIYEVNANAWMDINIFNEWFEKCFLKSVKERQLNNGRREATLLLLDNTHKYHHSKILDTKDEFVRVIHRSFDGILHIQPIDRGIIPCFKRMYRKELLETLIPIGLYYTMVDVIDNHNTLIMWDCCRMVRDAWSDVNNRILKRGWDVLLGRVSEPEVDLSLLREKDATAAQASLIRLRGYKCCDRDDVLKWFEIENKRNIFITIFTDEVVRNFKNNTLH
jgi:hypothetical protein